MINENITERIYICILPAFNYYKDGRLRVKVMSNGLIIVLNHLYWSIIMFTSHT